MPPSPPREPSSDIEADEWPLRSWGLALLGALVGLAIHWIVRPDRSPQDLNIMQTRAALATFLGVGSLVFGFVVERARISWSVAAAAIGAAVVALTIYWNGPFGARHAEEPWRIVCAVLAVGIAAPLFQAWRDGRTRWPDGKHFIPYPQAHGHAWTNVVLWCAAWVFVGVTWAMALLLGQLFRLIGIRVLSDLLEKDWMILLLTGAALGAGIGLLRDRDNILRLLQRVVTTILSVLAPVLAFGLVAFLAAIPFTGLSALWDATRSTSPILLGCVIGALCLVNAVIGDEASHEARNPVLRGSVAALGIAMLPLGVIAAISTGLRIDQHGLTPDRLWAVVFTAIACAYGLAYLVALGRWRLHAALHLRVANLRLAVGLCGLALILSTPLVNFGKLSARDQIARLNSGRTPLDTFDWRALRFDFGQAGQAAVRRLADKGRTPQIRAAAQRALKAENRWEIDAAPWEPKRERFDVARLAVLPRGTRLPQALHDKLSQYNACSLDGACTVLHEPGSTEAVIVTSSQSHRWVLSNGTWDAVQSRPLVTGKDAERREAALKAGKVEVREVQRRQVFVDGQPVGDEFE
ncbi:MAG: hypothetical protein K0R64_3177 [Novosphingobium lindaniclasticum]|jgi:hypothetical protein|uniref:DUF4153 domain-containing protein n=1 Tax=Novosphingobium lindaniclasticum TaxID=1329895 RepID=UPI0024099E9F|nr:DUF4153 domain-containing protein [Novosphingobium lindaniclasticum]MDF2640193.1 hypothetical protein [Novosphingobium lindaniclasticum]